MRKNRFTRPYLAVLLAMCSVWLMLASPASAAFDISAFDGTTPLQGGEPATQAGSHPFLASTSFSFSTYFTPGGREWPTGTLKDAVVDLPAGLSANSAAYPTCTDLKLVGASGGEPDCPESSQVGVLILKAGGGTAPFNQVGGLYNMERPGGATAVLGANIAGSLIHLVAGIRTGGDYGVRISSRNTPQTVVVEGATVILWGTPAAPAFDSQRRPTAGPSTAALRPFLTLPTSCLGPLRTDLHVTTWEGEADSSFFLSHDDTTPVPNPIGTTGCNTLGFSPALRAHPTTSLADSPSGLEADLHFPQDDFDDPDKMVEAQLRDAVATLPEGIAVNPAAANGLQGCSAADVGLTSAPGATPIAYTEAAAHCPDASKVGSVEIGTPLLDHQVRGDVYLATPFDNPFGSLLAFYVAVDDGESGIVVKLAGGVEADPASGRLTATFTESPQLPFEDLRLDFFGGPGGLLRTPATCGTYSTASSLTPWSAPDSGPPATPSDTYSIEQAPTGGVCPRSPAEQPHVPSFDAGAISPVAGADSPFVADLRREDGSQQFSSLALTPPRGLVAKLAGVSTCADSALATARARTGREEERAPSCPAASRVGSVAVGAGAGFTPFYLGGSLYLASPYKGAPLSLAIVVPALAGPFDLGTIVVRAAIQVDPRSAQITVESDPIPSILQGIPLDVRSLQLRLDRPGFTLNPTSCEPTAVSGQLLSTLGQGAPLRSRFQLGECGRLGFAPKLRLSLRGRTGRNAHPALTAVLTPRPDDANVAGISVSLPPSMLLAQEHIRGVCTRARFAARACPPDSVYGSAEARTPLLDQPLSGDVYLRSSDNRLPDLAVMLRGPDSQPIELELSGRIDSAQGGIRIAFAAAPDAPVSRLVLRMRGGRDGLLVNARGICLARPRARVRLRAQNGKRATRSPRLRTSCR
jgi:hypothetical protein